MRGLIAGRTGIRAARITTVVTCMALAGAGDALGRVTDGPRGMAVERADAAEGGRLPACRMRRPHFRTLPHLRPVKYCFSRRRPLTTTAGRLLVTPRPGRPKRPGEQYGAMVLSNGGQILWFSPRRGRTHDLKAVTVDGAPRLAVFEHGNGGKNAYELLDERYRPVQRIVAGNGLVVNSHELQLTPWGTVYLSSYRPVRVMGVGLVTEFVVQELDRASGEVLFEWHSLDHVPVTDSYTPQPTDGTSWDYFHGNSIEPPARPDRGTIIISARRTSAIYGIDRRTGKVRWRLGGKRDQFGLDRHPGWRFCAQHDARRMPDGDLTLFDNGGAGLGNERDCPMHAARMLRFELHGMQRRARLVRVVPSRLASEDGRGYFPTVVGSARRLPNGDDLISWGSSGRVTQTTPGGEVKWRLRLRDLTYRAIRADHWVGRPAGRPKLLAERRTADTVRLWASWNGATEIRHWRASCGSAPDELEPAGRPFRWRDLETSARVRTRGDACVVEALDADGTVLGRSTVEEVQPATASAG